MIDIKNDIMFSDLFNRHRASVFYYCFSIIKDHTDAEDIAMITFTKLWNSKAQFTEPAAIKDYLFTIARNECLNYLKQRKRRLVLNEFDEDIEIACDTQLARTFLLEAIYYEIQSLPPMSRKVFKMVCLEDIPRKEVCERLNISKGAIDVHCCYARNQLRKKFKNFI